MSRSKQVVIVTVVLVAAAGAAVAVTQAAKVRRNATMVADDIENQLGELDPVTRAAVLGKLSVDAAREARSHS
jgi:hypothetical protein